MLLVSFAAISCKKDSARTGLAGRPPEPSMAGTWIGSLNTASSTTTITMTMTQDTVNVDGKFVADQVTVFGASGTVTGVTTGNSFLMSLTPATSGCHAELNIGGNNDGSDMAFSFTGLDCSSATIVGQGYFSKT